MNINFYLGAFIRPEFILSLSKGSRYFICQCFSQCKKNEFYSGRDSDFR